MATAKNAGQTGAQLALPVGLQDHAVFESFLPRGNDAVVAYLAQLGEAAPGTPGCWLRGQPATGKTHLLQAVCVSLGDEAMYWPLAQVRDAGAGILEGLATRRCICLDDIDAVAGRAEWESGLFRLLNELIERDGLLVAAARSAPRDCGFRLPDLVSRLGRLPLFRLQPLSEADRLEALRLRAAHRGLDLPPEAARYLLQRSRRDMASLYAWLDRLDTESLKAQRRLTLPFVRKVLRQPDGA